jgi:hypothetical protein
MKPVRLSSLKAKPTLVEKLIEDADIIEAFGGPLQFWTWDRIPLETYMALVSADQDDISSRFAIARKLILEEDGTVILTGDEVFTPAVMTVIVGEVFSGMGNLQAGTPTGKTPQ